MSRQPAGWYLRRLRRMSAREVGWRVHDQLVRSAWRRQQVRPHDPPSQRRKRSLADQRHFTATLPDGAADGAPGDAVKAIVSAADSIMAGEAEILGVVRKDLVAPDWFADPVTGTRSDPSRYAFGINHRSQEQVGNVKLIWELSRHQHITQLAAAWYLTGNEAYAERAAAHLRSWWRENPYLSGIHWTSGIELGVRLINWAWTRRLLDRWPPVAEVFENYEPALQQIDWHQRYLARLRSRGSSANNHAIAEAAGQLAGACAFPWFRQSARWRAAARKRLQHELAANTFRSGVNRELATDYHRFVAELGVLAAVEADVAGCALDDRTWALLTRMLDVSAALVDSELRPPRQGDDDEGRVLVLDPADPHSWSGLLALGGSVVQRLPWWPATTPGVTSALVTALTHLHAGAGERPARRPDHFPDAGITLLRTDDDRPEIWCRCDGGPHGFLSIAAHAHADALSLEVRVGGVDVLADPGTYCYHGEQAWRDYFRSTIAHNTVEIAGTEQSEPGGPFLWLRHAAGNTASATTAHDRSVAAWRGEHDGYRVLRPPARHLRSVELDREARTLRVVDHIASGAGHGVRLAFHLGPRVEVALDGTRVSLRWPGGEAEAVLEPTLSWSAHRGETDPILGWYSPRFGHKVPTTTLLGTGPVEQGQPLTSTFSFRPAR